MEETYEHWSIVSWIPQYRWKRFSGRLGRRRTGEVLE
jgi:hypothetical protein